MATEAPNPEEAPAPGAAASPEGAPPSPPIWELLFEEHKITLLILVSSVIVGIFAWIIVDHRGEARKAVAAAAFSNAASIADYEAVSRDHSGTAPAGSALLMKADLERREDKLKESQATLTSFVASYPDHPLHSQGLLGLAAQAHEKGELDEAWNYLQQVIDASDSADSAPLAVIRKGDIAYERGDYEAARSLYQSVAPAYPGSPFSYKAEQKLRREKLLPPKPEPAPAPAPAAPSALLPPAPAPAPAPAATPAPTTPPAPAAATAPKKPAASPAAKPAPLAPKKPAPKKADAVPTSKPVPTPAPAAAKQAPPAPAKPATPAPSTPQPAAPKAPEAPKAPKGN